MAKWDGAWIGVAGSVAGGIAGGAMTLVAAIVASAQRPASNCGSAPAICRQCKLALLHQPAEYDEELQFLSKTFETAKLLRTALFDYDHYLTMKFNSIERDLALAADHMVTFQNQMFVYSARFPKGYPTSATRQTLIDAGFALADAVDLLLAYLSQIIRGNGEVVPEDEAKERRQRVSAAASTLRDSSG